MLDIYSPTPYLRLEKRLVTLPPIDPIREVLKHIKSAPADYPPDLLKARRAAFVEQIKTFGPNRPLAKGL
jgi:hypothetical protein